MKNGILKKYYSAERAFGIIFILIGSAGLYDTVYGSWLSSGPGFGAAFFPQLIFILLIVVGLSFQVFFRTNKTRLIDWNDVKTIVLLIGTGAVYFQMVRRLGIISSTFIYCTLLIGILTDKPFKHIRLVVIPGLIGTVIVWLLFTRLVDMVLPRPFLF